MIKYHLCIKKSHCSLQLECLITTGKRCGLTNGKCKYQGCQMVVPNKKGEDDGRLIIAAIEEKL
jgi:hypothetical protein